MEKLMCNNVIFVGDFKGPDIEEGTFHEQECPDSLSPRNTTPKCPCPPIESHGANASDDSNKDKEKDTDNDD